MSRKAADRQSRKPRRRSQPSRERECGSAITEMALLVPLIVLLTLGAFELGRGVWTKHTLSHISREAARYASVRSARSDDPATAVKVASRARSEAAGIDLDRLEVVTTWNPGNQPNARVRVQVSYEFEPVTPLLPFESITLTSNSERVIVY